MGGLRWNSTGHRRYGYLRFNEPTGELMISRGLDMPPSRARQLPEPLAQWEELREPVTSSVPGGDWVCFVRNDHGQCDVPEDLLQWWQWQLDTITHVQ